jgi:hypothetical protein
MPLYEPRSVQKCILSAPVFRDRSTLSRPPGMKPQRPSPEIKHTPTNAQPQHTFTTYEEHSQTSIQHRISCRKNCFCIKLKLANACIYKGVLELSLALPNLSSNFTLLSLKMRSENIFYLRGLLERFLPDLPTLFNYNEWVV